MFFLIVKPTENKYELVHDRWSRDDYQNDPHFVTMNSSHLSHGNSENNSKIL